jgi:hypothetical protein
MPARTSRESVIDVLSFMLLIYYHAIHHKLFENPFLGRGIAMNCKGSFDYMDASLRETFISLRMTK